MAFSSSISERTVFGNKRVHYGTFTATGSGVTSGNIDTGLSSCEHITLTPYGTAPGSQLSVNETLPVDGSAVTIDCAAEEITGYWIAYGY